MRKIFGCLVALALPLASSVPTWAEPAARAHGKPRFGITVRVHNQVQLTPKSLTFAEQVASGILQEAGLQVRWLDCSVDSPPEIHRCALPLGPTDFVLILTDSVKTLSPELSESTLGFALLSSESAQGLRAYLSYRHAQDIAQESAVAVERVLGVGAAHELGHLLLGGSPHSSVGIMKHSWGGSEVKVDSGWKLWFTPQQSAQIRSNLQLRQADAQIAGMNPKPMQ